MSLIHVHGMRAIAWVVVLVVGFGVLETPAARVDADGWPSVQYQWFVNNRPVKGATKPKLNLMLYCKSTHEKRSFRCLKVYI